MVIKRDKQIEKIKIAIDVALYYFAITEGLHLLSKIISNLLFRNSSILISRLKIRIPIYAVLIVVILSLVILSNTLKRKIQEPPRIDNKPLLYITVAMLHIVTGLRNILIQIPIISSYNSLVIEVSMFSEKKAQYMNDLHWLIVPIIFYIFQIGIGAYFAFLAIKRNKHIEKIH